MKITEELQGIKSLVSALEMGADDLPLLSRKLFAVERQIHDLKEFVDSVEEKKRREALAQLLLDNGFDATDLRLLDGRAFTKNQAGKVGELTHQDTVIALDCRGRGCEDCVPF